MRWTFEEIDQVEQTALPNVDGPPQWIEDLNRAKRLNKLGLPLPNRIYILMYIHTWVYAYIYLIHIYVCADRVRATGIILVLCLWRTLVNYTHTPLGVLKIMEIDEPSPGSLANKLREWPKLRQSNAPIEPWWGGCEKEAKVKESVSDDPAAELRIESPVAGDWTTNRFPASRVTMLTLRASETSVLTPGPGLLSMIPTFLAAPLKFTKTGFCFPAGYVWELTKYYKQGDHEINAIGLWL